MMTTIEKIKAEIDKLYGEYKDKFLKYRDSYHLGLFDGLYMAKRVLDTIEEEPVSNDIEEAADNHIHEVTDAAGHPGLEWETRDIKDAFIAGAKWQKEQDDKELSDLLTIAHLQGAEQMKEQMMKEAREADVNTYRDLAAGKSWAEFVVEKPPKNLGDKVRIIIVKEDEK